MKEFLYFLLFVSIAVLALIEQSKPVPNKFIIIGLIAFFNDWAISINEENTFLK